MKNGNVHENHSNQTWKSLPQLGVLSCDLLLCLGWILSSESFSLRFLKQSSPLLLCQSGLLFKQCPKKSLSLSSPETHLSAPTSNLPVLSLSFSSTLNHQKKALLPKRSLQPSLKATTVSPQNIFPGRTSQKISLTTSKKPSLPRPFP